MSDRKLTTFLMEPIRKKHKVFFLVFVFLVFVFLVSCFSCCFLYLF